MNSEPRPSETRIEAAMDAVMEFVGADGHDPVPTATQWFETIVTKALAAADEQNPLAPVVERLSAAFSELCDEYESVLAYVDDYFRAKWSYDEALTKARAVLAESSQPPEPGETILRDIPNRHGRTREDLDAARARIEDGRSRAKAGKLRDDYEWGIAQLGSVVEDTEARQ